LIALGQRSADFFLSRAGFAHPPAARATRLDP
jgi:hypothetical protein